MPDLLYAEDLVLCGESEEGLRVIVRQFAEVCSRRRGMKVKAGKRKAFGGQAYNLKGIKGKLSIFLLFPKICFSITVALFLA